VCSHTKGVKKSILYTLSLFAKSVRKKKEREKKNRYLRREGESFLLTVVHSSLVGRCTLRIQDRTRLDYDTDGVEGRSIRRIKHTIRHNRKKKKKRKKKEYYLTLLEASLAVGAFGAARVAVETFPSAGASTGSVDRIAFRSI